MSKIFIVLGLMLIPSMLCAEVVISTSIVNGSKFSTQRNLATDFEGRKYSTTIPVTKRADIHISDLTRLNSDLSNKASALQADLVEINSQISKYEIIFLWTNDFINIENLGRPLSDLGLNDVSITTLTVSGVKFCVVREYQFDKEGQKYLAFPHKQYQANDYNWEVKKKYEFLQGEKRRVTSLIGSIEQDIALNNQNINRLNNFLIQP